jgi:YidC/Oxa1 family membrane protein insertase
LFTTYIAQPIFNLLVLIYAIIPGHNFGLSIIVFTALIRLLLWPLLQRQLHQTKLMRKLQPELKKIKQQTKGDKQRESVMVMALYKEHGVNPFGSIGIVLLQFPILIALYAGLRRVLDDPHQLISFAYPALRHLSWMQTLSHNIHHFDATLFGVVDLTKSALGTNYIYWPAMIIVLGSAVVQYYQGKQLLVTDKNARSIRDILRDASSGKEADQAEVSSAIGGMTRFLIPVMVLLFTVHLPSALGLYWLVGGLIAFGQQSLILREDVQELEAIADASATKRLSTIPEAEIVTTEPSIISTLKPSKITVHGRKRRKKR